jgi:hypothetical protein
MRFFIFVLARIRRGGRAGIFAVCTPALAGAAQIDRPSQRTGDSSETHIQVSASVDRLSGVEIFSHPAPIRPVFSTGIAIKLIVGNGSDAAWAPLPRRMIVL